MTTIYGDINPRTAVHSSKQLLKRAHAYLCLEHFGQAKPIPSKSSKTIVFRRYDRFPHTPTALVEGVTPSARQLTTTDYTATLQQYGDRIQITDVIQDTHEDPVLNESIDVLSEQAAHMIETVRYHVVRGGTNVMYANGANRAAVNTALSKTKLRQAVKSLKRQDAKKITRMVKSSENFETHPVNAAYVALCHTDCEPIFRDMDGFVPVEKYGQMTPFEGEIGKVEETRIICSTIFEPWADAGAAAGGNFESTSGTNCDVYPVLVLGADAFGIVPLKGKHSITPMVVNPKPSDSDPLAQRGHAAWKTYHAAVILNEAWMVRLETAAPV